MGTNNSLGDSTQAIYKRALRDLPRKAEADLVVAYIQSKVEEEKLDLTFLMIMDLARLVYKAKYMEEE